MFIYKQYSSADRYIRSSIPARCSASSSHFAYASLITSSGNQSRQSEIDSRSSFTASVLLAVRPCSTSSAPNCSAQVARSALLSRAYAINSITARIYRARNLPGVIIADAVRVMITPVE